MSSWLLSLRLGFLSAGVLSTAMMVKLLLPVLIEFLNYELPYLWSIAIIWLKPPYLYVVLNCIILTIVASSKLQPQKTEIDGFAVAPVPVPIKVPDDVSFANQSPIKPAFGQIDADPVVSPVVFGFVEDVEEEVLEAKPEEETVEAVVSVSETETDTENEEFVISKPNWVPPRKRDPTEKPLVSQRFGNRRSVKASPEGGKALLRVSKPKRQNTLESTWRMITEGRPMPLTRHLKKSETWDTQGRGPPHHDSSLSTSPAHTMKKSETFNDRVPTDNSALSPSPSGGSGKLRREASLSQDELNRRVEAFIRKFNEEMRLQRQESLKQYRDMVGHGTR